MARLRGCLALGCGQAETKLIEPLVHAMQRAGWDALYMDMPINGRVGALDEVRDAYVRLANARGCAAVVGLGMGATLAMLLAEQYAVSALVCVAPAHGDGRKARALSRLAQRNLFAVVSPTLVVQPLGKQLRANGVRRIMQGVSTKACRVLWIPGECPLGAPGVQRDGVIAAILEHLCHAYDTNSLAN